MSDGTLVLPERSSAPTGVGASTKAIWVDDDGLINSTDSSNVSHVDSQVVDVPANASSSGVAGQIAFATGFLYICIAANTWEKVVIATW